MTMFNNKGYGLMKTLIMLALVMVMTSTSYATTLNHGSTSYSGENKSYTSSTSSGGSMASTEVNGNGAALQGSYQATGGTAYAGGSVNGSGVESVTNTGSYAVTGSAGFQGGNATGTTSAGGGTDVKASSNGKSFVKTNGFSGWGSFGW